MDRCDCVRCRGIDTKVVRRSVVDIFLWSLSLVTRPNVAFAVAVVAAFQISMMASDAVPGVITAVSVFGAYVVLTGYVCRHALKETTDYVSDGSRNILKTVIAVPSAVLSFCVFAFLLGSVVVFWIAMNELFLPGPVTLVLIMVTGLYLIFRTMMFPQACFIDGKGPVGSIRDSWRVSKVSKGRLIYLLVVGVGYVVLSASVPELLNPGTETLRVTVDLDSYALGVEYGQGFGWRMALNVVSDILFMAVYVGFLAHVYIETGHTPET